MANQVWKKLATGGMHPDSAFKLAMNPSTELYATASRNFVAYKQEWATKSSEMAL